MWKNKFLRFISWSIFQFSIFSLLFEIHLNTSFNQLQNLYLLHSNQHISLRIDWFFCQLWSLLLKFRLLRIFSIVLRNLIIKQIFLISSLTFASNENFVSEIFILNDLISVVFVTLNIFECIIKSMKNFVFSTSRLWIFNVRKQISLLYFQNYIISSLSILSIFDIIDFFTINFVFSNFNINSAISYIDK